MSALKAIEWDTAKKIIAGSHLLTGRSVIVLSTYYGLTLLSALLDGSSLVLLIDVLSGNSQSAHPDPIITFASNIIQSLGFDGTPTFLLLGVIVLLLIRVVVTFIVTAMDGYISAHIRRRIQERGFSNLMEGDWEVLRDLRVGQKQGAVTEEATLVTKYLTSAIRMFYFATTSTVLVGIAFMMSFELAALLAVVAVPVIIVLQVVFSRQSRLSTSQALARQGFAADVGESLGSLFQIKVEGQQERHLMHGLRRQGPLAALETQIGYCQAMIGAVDLLLPVLGLFAFCVWSWWRNQPITESMYLLAGVGVVGARAAVQLNGAIACWGNLTRFSGSLIPVKDLFAIPQQAVRTRIPLNEAVAAVRFRGVGYDYGRTYISDVNFLVEIGRPLVIRGPSGAGKTTIANLMAGIYRPTVGEVAYIGMSGATYDARSYQAKVGYVTQDIQLLHRTARQNLDPTGTITEDMIWLVLETVGARTFVKAMGGLDAMIAEAGRSLSGGERRRLGIARTLMAKPDILILDEIMVGLDPQNRFEISRLICDLSQTLIVMTISHDPNDFASWEQWEFLTPAQGTEKTAVM